MPIDAPSGKIRPGFFATLEGPEGAGKSTQLRLLARWLEGQGIRVLTTREPGGTKIGDRIRAVLLDPSHTEMRPHTEILLFSAARAQVVEERIRPHLGQGGVVLCDRYYDSTLAYQGYGHGMDLEILRTITDFATGGLAPDLTVLLDLPVEVGLKRKVGGQGDDWNRMEQKERSYHERVRSGYLELAAREPLRWLVVDATGPVNVIQHRIRDKLMGEMVA